VSSNFGELVGKNIELIMTIRRWYISITLVRIRLNLNYSFHKNIRGRERKWIKRIEEEARERVWGLKS